MHCIVTSGPTYEPLDQVRRLTNFSTGRLGTELARHLAGCGHPVTLLRGALSTCTSPVPGVRVQTFETTADLRAQLAGLAGSHPADLALFHAAAVSDFAFGQVYERQADGELRPVQSGKHTTRGRPLLVELRPTPKILAELRAWYPAARIIGWKYEVEGGPDQVLARVRQQIQECRLNASVANGPAYGPGFGVVTPPGEVRHCVDAPALFDVLGAFV